jgi:hypothetical protein
MKILLILTALLFTATSPLTTFAADSGSHASHAKGHDGHQGDIAHEQVIDGVKAVFKVMGMKEHLKALGMELPKGMKETHHISVEFKDIKSGKALKEGEARMKLQSPDKTEQTKDLVAMQGHFGADFDLSKKGKYGVMSKFQLKDGKVRSTKFWYTVK